MEARATPSPPAKWYAACWASRALSALLGSVLAVAICTSTPIARAAGEGTGVVVNGVALTAETVRALQQAYPVAIAPWRYWYDSISGACGRERQPIAGQMIAGLALGGPMRADASRRTSGVFINGRHITTGEKAYIEQLCQTPVIPGRYWTLFNGLGGYEGGPACWRRPKTDPPTALVPIQM